MKDKRIDSYIAKAQPFAKPILEKLRLLIHKACPEVSETIKWGMPAFEYKGPLCGMAFFKQHCVFNFWKASLLTDPKGYLQPNAAKGGEAMGHLGRLTSPKEIPPDKIMISFIKQAMKLNDENIKPEKKKTTVGAEVELPEYVKKAFHKNKKAESVFKNFTPSARNEYIQWITSAKTEVTRLKRLSTAIEWISEGKRMHWKYEKK